MRFGSALEFFKRQMLKKELETLNLYFLAQLAVNFNLIHHSAQDVENVSWKFLIVFNLILMTAASDSEKICQLSSELIKEVSGCEKMKRKKIEKKLQWKVKMQYMN